MSRPPESSNIVRPTKSDSFKGLPLDPNTGFPEADYPAARFFLARCDKVKLVDHGEMAEARANDLRKWLPEIEAALTSADDDAKRDGGRQESTAQPDGGNAMQKVLAIYTSGVANERFEKIAEVLGGNGTVDEKLEAMNRLVPIPPTTSAQTLGEQIGVSATAVKKTNWWKDNRAGKSEATAERRLEQHKRRAAESNGNQLPRGCRRKEKELPSDD